MCGLSKIRLLESFILPCRRVGVTLLKRDNSSGADACSSAVGKTPLCDEPAGMEIISGACAYTSDCTSHDLFDAEYDWAKVPPYNENDPRPPLLV